jgi:signal transduction histidine kinase
MLVERRSLWRVGTESTWTTILPVGFIIVSLLSLVILPVVESHRTSRMRMEITAVAEPARRAANGVQTDLSSELDKVIAFQVTGEGQYRVEYERLVAEQQSYTAVLQKLVSRLDPDVDADLASTLQNTVRWHEGVKRAQFLDTALPKEVFLTRLYEQHPAYEKSLASASQLEIAIQNAIEDRLTRIREVERVNIWLSIILSLLALTSALLVAGLGRQMRLLAHEAMGRRQEAEHEAADAKLARASAEREERRAAFLASAGQELAASLDYQQTIDALARLVVPNLADLCSIDIDDEEGQLRRAAIKHRDAGTEKRLSAQIGEAVVLPDGVARIIADRSPRLVGGSTTLYEYLGSEGDGSRSFIVMPLISRGQTLGLVIAAARQGRTFTDDDLMLFAELARHASLAIDNARLYLHSQQAVRAREEVLAIVSHDLRNPLNAVTLAASLLKTSESIAEEDREQLDLISVSANRMSRLIADLLDATRLEGGKRLPIQPQRVEVGQLMREARELFRAQAAAGGIALQLDDATSLPPVHADRDRIMQVLSNLIGNAMKFTPAGGTICCRAEKKDREVLFRVSDTGSGIPQEHVHHIFTPYWQAKRAERMGAGLGLAITKGIVESHGGKIWVESEPGKGTTFFFTLPVEG